MSSTTSDSKEKHMVPFMADELFVQDVAALKNREYVQSNMPV